MPVEVLPDQDLILSAGLEGTAEIAVRVLRVDRLDKHHIRVFALESVAAANQLALLPIELPFTVSDAKSVCQEGLRN